MATDVSSVIRHFPSAENGFTTTTSGSVSSGATTVGLNSVAGYSNGEVAVFVIDPTDVSKKQVFTGVIDTAGVQVTNVVWTAGTNHSHALGATVVDYTTATHISMVSKGLLRDHNQSGYHKTLNDDNGNEWIKQSSAASAVNEITVGNAATGNNPTISATGNDTNIGITISPKGTATLQVKGRFDGWNDISSLTSLSTSSGYNKGNKEFDITSSVDMTSVLSPGMRLKFTRGTTPTTQSTSLNGTTQYWSKSSPTGMSGTDNFTWVQWVYPTSYQDSTMQSRVNNAGVMTDGWKVYIFTTGQVGVLARNGGAGNYRYVLSAQSVPLNRWSHIAVTWASGTVTMYIDGVSVPVLSAVTSGTAPTTWVATGDYNIGRSNSTEGLYFPGKLAHVAVYSSVLTATQIRDRMYQSATGAEANMISGYTFDGNANDLTANANNLTANGSATATNASNPFNATEYALVTKVTASTITVFTGTDYGVPTGVTLSTPYYSTQKTPFGFPSIRGKWVVETWNRADNSSPANSTYNHNITLTVPTGEWMLGYEFRLFFTNSTQGPNAQFGISTSSSSLTSKEYNGKLESSTSNSSISGIFGRTSPVTISSATPYYTVSISGNSGTSQSIRDATDSTASFIRAECAYV